MSKPQSTSLLFESMAGSLLTPQKRVIPAKLGLAQAIAVLVLGALLTTPASAQDTDGDGIPNAAEATYGTNPALADTDGDGAGDWYEVFASFTSPTNPAIKPNVPYPLPKPDNSTGVTNKPVKVFILAGQSNMVGMGDVNPITANGTLSKIVKTENKFPNLVDTSGNWSVRKDVQYRGVISAIAKGNLTVGQGANTSAIGPELGMGHVLGYQLDEPVLIIKAAQGNRSLGWDFLPPASPRSTSGSTTWAGYGDSSPSWTGTPPGAPGVGNSYAGWQYDQSFLAFSDWYGPGSTTDVENTADVLDNWAIEYPQWAAQGFEIAGFAWFQGWNDGLSYTTQYADRYEANLVQLIKQLRTYYEGRYPTKIQPKAPFVVATCGFSGFAATGNRLKVANAQLAVGNPTKYPEFAGNVKSMETRGYWRTREQSNSKQDYHYWRNAETFMLVGDALGRGMIDLLATNTPQPSQPNTWSQTAGGAQSWTTSANWQDGTIPNPTSTTTMDFSSANIATDTTLTLGANRTAQIWKFGDTSGTQNWIVNAGNTMTLAGTTPTIEVVNNTTRLDNILAGTVGLTKTGVGTLTLTAINTYTGITTIAAGTLALSGGNNTLVDTGAVNLSSNASTFNLAGLTTGETIGSLSGVAGSILNLGSKALTVGDANSTTFAGNITTSTGGTLIKNGAGNLTLSGFNAYRTTTINAGTLEIAGGGTTASTASWTGAGRLAITGGALTSTSQNFNLPNTMNIVDGSVSGQGNRFNAAATNHTGGNVNIVGSSTSGSWIGYGANRNATYTVNGTATLSVNGDAGSGAYLSIGRENSNAAQTAALVLQTGGTVNIGTTSHGNLYIGQFSGSNAANGKLDVQGGTLTVGTFDSNNTLGFFFGGSTGSLKAEMTQSGGTVTTRGILFGAGGGTYVNTATANLTLSGGVLYIGTGGITASSGFTSGGTVANITLLGGTLGASGDWTSSMAMKLGNATIQSSNSEGAARSITLTGVLSNATGAGTLTKTGDGTLTLSGNNTYTGATVINGGTLALGASNTLPATSVTIGNATLNSATFSDSLGTLNVTGTAAINLGAGANLSFAASNSIPWPGTLNLTGTFISGSSLRFGTAPGGLTSIQLGKISATGFTGFALNSSGYLTALPAGFPAWIAGTFANGQVPPDKRGANHDPDNDGIPNLIEYAIAGHDPTMANPSIGTFTGTSLSYTKRPGTTGLAYAIQESTDLGLADTWAELPPSGSYQNDTGTISFTFTLGVPAKNFLRLQVVSN